MTIQPTTSNINTNTNFSVQSESKSVSFNSVKQTQNLVGLALQQFILEWLLDIAKDRKDKDDQSGLGAILALMGTSQLEEHKFYNKSEQSFVATGTEHVNAAYQSPSAGEAAPQIDMTA